MKKNKLFLCAFAALSVLAVSCSKDDDADTTAPAVTSTVTVRNLAADTGNTSHYVFFRLSDSTIVPLSDSASTKWDIGFRTTSIIVNGGVSGPGTAAAQTVATGFADLTNAPATGYLRDSAGGRAIAAWYDYNPTTHIVTPKAGNTIVVKTANNKYAKISILSYYKDAVAAPQLSTPSRYYTFRYSIQQNGTANF